MLSVDIFCKEYGPRLGPMKNRCGSGSKLFDTLMVCLIMVRFEGTLAGSKGNAKLKAGVNIYIEQNFLNVLIIEFLNCQKYLKEDCVFCH